MILIKIGGGKKMNYEGIAKDIAELFQKEQIVIVHGASSTRNEVAEKLGIPTKKITSPSGITSVYTDEAAIEVFLMTYCGVINKKIVATLQAHNVNAIGLSGIDGKLWQAKRKDVVYSVENGKTKLIRDNLTGKVEKINHKLLTLLCEAGYVPVICPPAISYENEIVNTDNDTAIGVMAEALAIEKIIFLFEATGLLRDVTDSGSVIAEIKNDELETFMDSAVGTMKKKLLGTKKALAAGVKTVYYSDGRIDYPIKAALEGKGTIITA